MIRVGDSGDSAGVYKVPYSPPLGEGEFIMSVGEEYQFVKRGRDRLWGRI